MQKNRRSKSGEYDYYLQGKNVDIKVKNNNNREEQIKVDKTFATQLSFKTTKIFLSKN